MDEQTNAGETLPLRLLSAWEADRHTRNDCNFSHTVSCKLNITRKEGSRNLCLWDMTSQKLDQDTIESTIISDTCCNISLAYEKLSTRSIPRYDASFYTAYEG